MIARGRLVFLLSAGMLVSLGLGMSACNSGGAAGSGPLSGARAMAHVRKMVALGPRPSGSASLLANKNQIRDHLLELGLKVHEDDWWETDSVRKKKVRMHNIWTEIPGDDPEHGPILLLCAHYDSKLCQGHDESDGVKRNFEFVGAIDGAGASAVLMELARHLKVRDYGPNIWILWVDGEESIPWTWKSDNTECLHGSKRFVKLMKADKKRFPRGLAQRIKAFVLLDLIGSKNFKIDHDKASSPALNRVFKTAAESMGQSKRMFAHASEMTDDHLPFKWQGVTVIDLIDFHYRIPNSPDQHPDYQAWWHSAADNLDAMDPDALAFAGNLVWTALPILEKEIFGK